MHLGLGDDQLAAEELPHDELAEVAHVLLAQLWLRVPAEELGDLDAEHAAVVTILLLRHSSFQKRPDRGCHVIV